MLFCLDSIVGDMHVTVLHERAHEPIGTERFKREVV